MPDAIDNEFVNPDAWQAGYADYTSGYGCPDEHSARQGWLTAQASAAAEGPSPEFVPTEPLRIGGIVAAPLADEPVQPGYNVTGGPDSLLAAVLSRLLCGPGYAHLDPWRVTIDAEQDISPDEYAAILQVVQAAALSEQQQNRLDPTTRSPEE